MQDEKSTVKIIPAELKSISDFSFLIRVIIWISILAFGAYLSLQTAPWMIAAGIIILGIGIAHGVELCHQALHNTGFTNSMLNEIVGVALGLPLLVSFTSTGYRIWLTINTSGLLKTPNFSNMATAPHIAPVHWSTVDVAALRAIFRNFKLVITGYPIPEFRDKHQPILRRYYTIVVGFVILLALAGYLTGTGVLPFLIWLGAMALVAGPIHALIEFPEHYRCDADTKDIFHNTRSIQTNWFMMWFTNGNNFHVEHHMHPTVPLQNARQVHDILHPDHANYNNSYSSFYRSVFQDLRKGGKSS